MSKRLTIIRHAKSVTDSSGSDRDRAINARGQGDAKLIGKFLSAQGIVFDQVYCSTAVRARQTFEKINELLHLSSEIIHAEEDLYLASLPVLLAYIEKLPNSYNHIAIVGHNPGLTELCNALCNDDLANLPTSGVYSVQFSCDDWRAAGSGSGDCQKLVTPRMLKEVLSQL